MKRRSLIGIGAFGLLAGWALRPSRALPNKSNPTPMLNR